MEFLESPDPVICQLCREPIWNFLCINCLGDNIKRWLPENFCEQFSKFHTEIKNHFHTFIADNYEPCIDCRKTSETPLCPYCYTHEVYHWISPINSDLARTFSKIFFFYPFEGTEEIKTESSPITETGNLREINGLCDNCDQYSETLVKSGKGWNCEMCREE